MKNSGWRKQSLEEVQAKAEAKRLKFNSEPQKQARYQKLQEKRAKVANLPKKAHTGADTIKRKRRKKSELKKLKEQLWQLCRQIQIKRYGNQCYTCPNKPTGSGLHLGHFIPSSVCSTEVRYSLTNLRPQCYRCNIHLSGNWLAFESHLIADSIDIQELKQRNEDTKNLSYRDDFYIQKIAEYTQILEGM